MSIRVLKTENGTTDAWAILTPDAYWYHEAWKLDLHVHPAFSDHLPQLVASLPWPDAPVSATLTEPAGLKATALEAAGFTRAGHLPCWLRTEDDTRRNVGLWVGS